MDSLNDSAFPPQPFPRQPPPSPPPPTPTSTPTHRQYPYLTLRCFFFFILLHATAPSRGGSKANQRGSSSLGIFETKDESRGCVLVQIFHRVEEGGEGGEGGESRSRMGVLSSARRFFSSSIVDRS